MSLGSTQRLRCTEMLPNGQGFDRCAVRIRRETIGNGAQSFESGARTFACVVIDLIPEETGFG